MKKFKRLGVITLALALVVSLAACGEDSKTTTAKLVKTTVAKESTTAEEKISGKVVIDGSGTVYPLMAHIAEEYIGKNPDVSVQVSRAGTSAGFKKFIANETDFSDASRGIKDKEIDKLKEQGLIYGTDVLEFKLAYDGLTIVINKDNTWAEEMTRQEIVEMFQSMKYKEDDKVLWSDIRSDWPAEEIAFYGPNENHGTYEFFWKELLEKSDLVKTATLEQEYSTLVDLVSKNKNAIAFFGYGYYMSNQDKLKAVHVDFGDGPVAPSGETIGEEKDYAGFTRPVFTYLNMKKAMENPAVMDFAKYILSPEGARKLAGENGFAPLPDSIYESYLQQLQ